MATDSILRNATEEERGRAVEDNLVAMFRSMVDVLNGDLEESSKLGRYYTIPGSPIFKGVFNTNLSPDQTDETISD